MFTGPNIVEEGLVLALDAGNTKSYPGTGTTVYDLSGDQYNGTLVNGMAFDSEAGGCFVGDGTNDNITYAASAESKGTLTNSITYECWVKRTGTSAAASPRLMSTDISDYCALYLDSSGAGTLRWRINIGGSTKDRTYSTGLALNEWTHVVGTAEYDGSSTYSQVLYVNGTSVASAINGSATGNWGDGTSRAFAIFSNVESTVQNNNCLNGKLGPARVYNKFLTSSEVLQNYNATKTRFGL